jgi:hypothetical protein
MKLAGGGTSAPTETALQLGASAPAMAKDHAR